MNGASITWVGGVSATCSLSANWQPSLVPTAADDVIIPAAATFSPLCGAALWRSLALEGTPLRLSEPLVVLESLVSRADSLIIPTSARSVLVLGASPTVGAPPPAVAHLFLLNVSAKLEVRVPIRLNPSVDVSVVSMSSVANILFHDEWVVPAQARLHMPTIHVACAAGARGMFVIDGLFEIGGLVQSANCLPITASSTSQLAFTPPFFSVMPILATGSLPQVVILPRARLSFLRPVALQSILVMQSATLVLGGAAGGAVVSSNTTFQEGSELEVCLDCSCSSHGVNVFLDLSQHVGTVKNVPVTGSMADSAIFARGSVAASFTSFVNGFSIYRMDDAFVIAATCDRGSYLNQNCAGTSLVCSPCPPGTFSNVTQSLQCTVCPAGTVAFPAGQTSCYPCICGSAFVESWSPCVPLATSCFSNLSLPENYSSVVSDPSLVEPGDIPGYVALGVTAGVLAVGAGVIGICMCASVFAEVSSAIANSIQAVDGVAGDRWESHSVPGPVVSRKGTWLGGLVTLVALVLLLGLSVFLVLDWSSTTVTSRSLLPFGTFTDVSASSDATGRFVFTARFVGYTGADCVGFCGYASHGIAFGTNHKLECRLEKGTDCVMTLDTGANARLSAEAQLSLWSSGSTASAVSWSVAAAPSWDGSDRNVVFQSLQAPIGGPSRLMLSAQYVVREDLSPFNLNSRGWFLLPDSIEFLPPNPGASNNSCNVHFELVRGFDFLYIEIQPATSVAVLIATIFAFAYGIFWLATAALRLIERAQKRSRGPSADADLAAFQHLYDQVAHQEAEGGINAHSDALQRVGRDFHHSEVRLGKNPA